MRLQKLAWESTTRTKVSDSTTVISERLTKPLKLIQDRTIDGAAVGSATHTLLQLLPLTSKPTLADLKQKLQELVASHQLPLALAKTFH